MIGFVNNLSSPVVDCDVELFNAVLDSPSVKKICTAIADAKRRKDAGEMSAEEFDAEKSRLKKKLPAFCFHAVFAEGKRSNANARPSGLFLADVDHLDIAPRSFYEKFVKGREQELGIVLAHMTPSAEGLRLVAIVPGGMDLIAAQKWLAAQLGDTVFDPAPKDLVRLSFAVPREYVFYLDQERLFADHTPAPVPAASASLPAAEECREPPKAVPEACQEIPDTGECYAGIPVADIIREYLDLEGGTPKVGERNTRLFRLACDLRYLIPADEDRLMGVLPRFGLSEAEVRSLVRSALSRPLTERGNLPKSLSRSLILLAPPAPMPEMPRRLPRIIKLLLSRTPDIYQPAVAHAVFPPLGAHLCGVSFPYIDGVEHEATLMCLLMAPTGSGKSCVNEPIRLIMRDIRARDAQTLALEQAWKNEQNIRSANAKRSPRPEVVVQEVMPDVTHAALVFRLKNAGGHFLYSQMNELDQFNALKGNTLNQHFQIMCLAFDPGNTYGQTRVSAEAVSETVTLRWNWNASSTIKKAKRFFAKVLADGPVSRVNICTIPQQELGAEMPRFGTYTSDFDEALRPYIENLTLASGRIECRQASKLAETLVKECADEARRTQSRVYENLSRRAVVIAWLKACVLYVAGGMKWERSIEDFARWSLQYDLWCKMHFFGEAMEKELDDNSIPSSRPGPRNQLGNLPDDFTLDDVVEMRKREGKKTSGARDQLRQWMKRGHVEEIQKGHYRKLKNAA